MPEHIVLIVAAGVGSRMGTEKPKQYQPISGLSVLERAVACFPRHTVHIVVSPSDAYIDELSLKNVHKVGGTSRGQSVLNGCLVLADLYPNNPWVLVHDAARCLLPKDALARLCNHLNEQERPALLALPVVDSLHRVRVDKSEAVSRESLWAAQTPQAARLNDVIKAYQQQHLPSDEFTALQGLGIQMDMVIGDRKNFKITYPEDIDFATLLVHAAQ